MKGRLMRLTRNDWHGPLEQQPWPEMRSTRSANIVLETGSQYNRFMINNTRMLKYYYLLTPVFFAIELMFDINIRITIPGESTAFRYIYYGVCFLCAFFVFSNPVTANFFSLAECVLNIFLLMLSIMYPVTSLAAGAETGNMTGYHFALSDLIHFLLAGSILLYAFYSNPIIRQSRKFRL